MRSRIPLDSTRLQGARRLVVKIGSSLLVDESHARLRRTWLTALGDDLRLSTVTTTARLYLRSRSLNHKKNCQPSRSSSDSHPR